jgi:hypothetical protein
MNLKKPPKPLVTPWRQINDQRKSQRQEGRLAKLSGGSKQINSGRNWFSKRDVRLNGFLIEARTTEKASYSIKKEEFENIVKNALSTPPGMLAAMQIDFPGLHLFVMRLEDHLFFQEYVQNLLAEIQTLKKGGNEYEAEFDA